MYRIHSLWPTSSIASTKLNHRCMAVGTVYTGRPILSSCAQCFKSVLINDLSGKNVYCCIYLFDQFIQNRIIGITRFFTHSLRNFTVQTQTMQVKKQRVQKQSAIIYAEKRITISIICLKYSIFFHVNFSCLEKCPNN